MRGIRGRPPPARLRGEARRVLEADDARRLQLAALRVEQDDAGRAEQVEALQQRRSSPLLAVTSARSSSALSSLACTAGSTKVCASISLQDTHQSA